MLYQLSVYDAQRLFPLYQLSVHIRWTLVPLHLHSVPSLSLYSHQISTQ